MCDTAKYIIPVLAYMADTDATGMISIWKAEFSCLILNFNCLVALVKEKKNKFVFILIYDTYMMILIWYLLKMTMSSTFIFGGNLPKCVYFLIIFFQNYCANFKNKVLYIISRLIYNTQQQFNAIIMIKLISTINSYSWYCF